MSRIPHSTDTRVEDMWSVEFQSHSGRRRVWFIDVHVGNLDDVRETIHVNLLGITLNKCPSSSGSLP
jgi:hypothetical protein